MKILALLLLSTNLFASEQTISFPESICNGGGGSWGNPVTVNRNICQNEVRSEIEINEGGHCNGYRQSIIKCRDNVIVGYELVDCFCD